MDAMENDCYMAMSVYKELRDMLGMEKVNLEENKYYMHCSGFAKEKLERYADTRALTGRAGASAGTDREKDAALSFGGAFTGAFFQQEFFGNGSYYLLIVPDPVAKNMQVIEELYVGVAPKELSMEVYKGIAAIAWENQMHVTGKAEIRESGASIVMSLSFPLFYLAFILLAAAATIMTVQILVIWSRSGSSSVYFRNVAWIRQNRGRFCRDILPSITPSPYFPPLWEVPQCTWRSQAASTGMRTRE